MAERPTSNIEANLRLGDELFARLSPPPEAFPSVADSVYDQLLASGSQSRISPGVIAWSKTRSPWSSAPAALPFVKPCSALGKPG